SRPVSRVLYPPVTDSYHLSRLSITQKFHLPTLQLVRAALNVGLRGISPNRVYLISLQHYLYILSVALVLTSRRTGVIRYSALWCPDFPLTKASDKTVCLVQKYYIKTVL